MSLLVPTTFGADYLEALQGTRVRSLYGSLPQDPSLRAKRWLPDVSEEQFESHVQMAADHGISFIYTLNSRSSGSLEFTAEEQRALLQRLQWLVDIGARGIVTANPYLMELTKRRFPELEVHVSTLADVNDVDKARFFENIGADALYVPEFVNRRFKLLQQLARRIKCRLVVTLNLGCLARCPIRGYHTECISDSGRSLDNGHFVDYSMMKCTLSKVLDASEVIKGPWVRPEDLTAYEDLGIEHFKIAGREQPMEWLLRAATAYSQRTYDGPLNDLVTGFDQVRPFGELPFRVDNRALDGFISFLLKKDCSLGCMDCNYCGRWATQAVTVDEELRERYARNIERVLNSFTSGAFRAPVTRAG